MNKISQLIEELLKNFREYIDNDLLFQIVISVFIIVLFFLVAKFASFVLKKIIKPLTKRTVSTIDDKIVEIVENSSYRLINLLGLYLGLQAFKGGFEHVSIKSHLKLIEEFPSLMHVAGIIENIIFIILVLLLLTIASQIVLLLFDWYAEKTNASENKDLHGSLFPLLKKVSRLLIALLGLIVVLERFNVNISAFVVSLGVGSLAIALAAQETLSNMISGFIIMIDRPFRIGDRIKIGNEIHGDVVSIGIRSTKFVDFDQNILIIPNNDVVKSRIVNYTYPTSRTRVVIDVTLPYGVDFNLVKNMILPIVESDPDVDKTEKPDFAFNRFGETGIEVKITMKTPDYSNAYSIGCRLREAIYKKFKEEKIDIPVTQKLIQISK